MKRSWLIKKSALLSSFYMAVPVEGDGDSDVFHRIFSPERRASYTVTYEGFFGYVPADLCGCRMRWQRDNLGWLRRTVSHHFWTDEPWVEFIAWGV